MNVEGRDDGTGWMAAWQPVIDRIGADMSDGAAHYGADRVEPALIRRYLEPLEFDCPLHYDIETARAHGFAQLTAPYTAAATFAMPPVWSPGEVLFTSADRDAQPARVSVKPRFPDGAPPVTGYFATDVETEYLRPVLAGERLGRRGNRLVACTPRETSVGRGAFVTFESDTVDEQGEVVTRMRATLFLYEPRPAAQA